MPPGAVKKRSIVVLGSRFVGKSSLVKKFVDNSFAIGYIPSLDITYTKNVVYNGIEYECDIIDTAGQDEFTIVNPNHVIGMHGYILVYSTKQSYDMITTIYDRILDYSGVKTIPTVIVASKCDLDCSQSQLELPQAEALAEHLGCAWIETSAKDDINVDKVFELCLQEIEKPNLTASEPTKLYSCTVQ